MWQFAGCECTECCVCSGGWAGTQGGARESRPGSPGAPGEARVHGETGAGSPCSGRLFPVSGRETGEHPSLGCFPNCVVVSHYHH